MRPVTFPVSARTTWCFISPGRRSDSGSPRRPESRPVRRRSLSRRSDELFDHFTQRGARACAISLPPDFEPTPIERHAVDPILNNLQSPSTNRLPTSCGTLSRFVFWTLAEHCAEYRLPFDLMIGVNRRVYEDGVHQGQDLFDQRTSLIQYRRLFNAFPKVTFPISVLAQTSNQELVSYSWIFPNVVTNGHWWYSNIPAYIELDCRSRLQAVPQTKQIGYYSDMYKLEFALPKFRMYRRILASALANDFVIGSPLGGRPRPRFGPAGPARQCRTHLRGTGAWWQAAGGSRRRARSRVRLAVWPLATGH